MYRYGKAPFGGVFILVHLQAQATMRSFRDMINCR